MLRDVDRRLNVNTFKVTMNKEWIIVLLEIN